MHTGTRTAHCASLPVRVNCMLYYIVNTGIMALGSFPLCVMYILYRVYETAQSIEYCPCLFSGGIIIISIL